jgi:hypothetical protein
VNEPLQLIFDLARPGQTGAGHAPPRDALPLAAEAVFRYWHEERHAKHPG